MEETKTKGTTTQEPGTLARTVAMAVLGRAAILEAPDLPEQWVEVPEWKGRVLVRGMTAAERDRYETGSLKGKGRNREVNLANLRARLVVLCTVDENRERLFQDADADKLGKKSALAVNRIFEIARKLSGMTEDDLEEMAGNSERVPSGSSASD